MYLKITVFPESKKEKVEKVKVDTYKMYLREKAEAGKANKRVVEIISQMHPGKRVRIVNGALTSKKLVEIF